MSSICALSPSVRLELTKTRLIARLPQYHRELQVRTLVLSLSYYYYYYYERLVAKYGCFIFEGSKCELSRRGIAIKGIVASGISMMGSSLTAEQAQG